MGIFISIMFDDWINKNYNELKKIVSSVSKTNDPDLFQLCVEQFINNPRTINIPDQEKLYFFTKIVKNNFFSKSSPYFYTYVKYKFNQLNSNDDTPETIQEDYIDMDWVNNELKKLDWYYKRLFELYIEEQCSITKLSKRTTIPINSVSRDINKVRRILNKRRINYLNNGL